MGKKKTSTQQQTNTYQQITPQNTADMTAVRDHKPQADPSIPHAFGRAKANLQGSFNNPLGAATTPAVREATLRAGEQELDQAQGQAERESFNDVNQQELQKKLALAGLTAPRIVQSGSSGTSTVPTPGIGESIIGGAASVGSAALL